MDGRTRFRAFLGCQAPSGAVVACLKALPWSLQSVHKILETSPTIFDHQDRTTSAPESTHHALDDHQLITQNVYEMSRRYKTGTLETVVVTQPAVLTVSTKQRQPNAPKPSAGFKGSVATSGFYTTTCRFFKRTKLPAVYVPSSIFPQIL